MAVAWEFGWWQLFPGAKKLLIMTDLIHWAGTELDGAAKISVPRLFGLPVAEVGNA